MSQDFMNDEYNEESKIRIMVENVALMLSRRKMYSELSFEDIRTQFLENINGYSTSYNDGTNIIEIYLTFCKITKVDKSDEDKYFTSDTNRYKILIAEMASPKVINMFDVASNSELVFIREVMSDRADHVSNPTLILLTEEQQSQVIKEYNLEPGHLPEIKFGTGALARYYQLKRGEIVEINSPSEAGYSIRYRICK